MNSTMRIACHCLHYLYTLPTDSPQSISQLYCWKSSWGSEKVCNGWPDGINVIKARVVIVLLTDNIYGPRPSNCWLPAATFAEGMVRSGHFDASLVVDAKKFNIAMSNLYGESMTHFDGSNHTGVFRIYDGRQYLYFFTDCKHQIQYPSPLNSAWKEML